MELHPVLPFLTYATPESLLVFNLALCAGALFLGPRKPGTSSDERFAACFVGAMWGAAFVFVQYKVSKYVEPTGGGFMPSPSLIVPRWLLAGVLTMVGAGWATRVALVDQQPTAPAVYLGISLAVSVAYAHVQSGNESASAIALMCGAFVFAVGVFVGLLARTGTEPNGRAHRAR